MIPATSKQLDKLLSMEWIPNSLHIYVAHINIQGREVAEKFYYSKQRETYCILNSIKYYTSDH